MLSIYNLCSESARGMPEKLPRAWALGPRWPCSNPGTTPTTPDVSPLPTHPQGTAPEFLRMTLTETTETRQGRLLPPQARVDLVSAVAAEGADLARSDPGRALNRYVSAIALLLRFERRPGLTGGEIPLRSSVAALPLATRPAANAALAAAFTGAGRCLLDLSDPDAAVYAASTALRFAGDAVGRSRVDAERAQRARPPPNKVSRGGRGGASAMSPAGPPATAAESEARLLRARANLARDTIRGLLRARIDLERIVEGERARGGRGGGGGHALPLAGVDVGALLAEVENEIRSVRGAGATGDGQAAGTSTVESDRGAPLGSTTEGFSPPAARPSWREQQAGSPGASMRLPTAELDGDVLAAARQLGLDLGDPMVLAELDVLTKAERGGRARKARVGGNVRLAAPKRQAPGLRSLSTAGRVLGATLALYFAVRMWDLWGGEVTASGLPGLSGLGRR